MTHAYAARLLPGLLGLLLLAGCGPRRPATAPVRGSVTYQGEPVTAGKIAFYPEHGRPALGVIGPDGTYRLTTFEPGDGALLGKHRVTIQATHVTGPSMPATFEDELAQTAADRPEVIEPVVEWLVPQEYSRRESTTLRADVAPKANTINFDLSPTP